MLPEALGGKTEAGNLVSSCGPCNSGKSSTAPDGPLIADVMDDALRWSRAIRVAAAGMLADEEALDAQTAEFERHWNGSRAGRWSSPPDGWRASVDRFLAIGLPLPVLLKCLDKASENRNIARGETFRYMCGIAWKKVAELQTAAREALQPAVGDGEPIDLVAAVLSEGEGEQVNRWAESARRQLDPAEPPPSAVQMRSLTAKAAVDEWVYYTWRLEETLDRILELFSPAEVERAREWAWAQYELNMKGQFNDTDVTIMTARRLVDCRNPEPEHEDDEALDF